MAPFSYPPAERVEVVDDYHGTFVPDPYRWLEDPDDDRTRDFVRAQNLLSMAYLQSLPERSRMEASMTRMWNVERSSAPTSRNGVTVWSHNDGLQDQPVYMVEGQDGRRRVLLDPNEMSEDGTVAITQISLSDDGSVLAYNASESGSDWQVIRLRDTTSGEDLDEEIHHVKFTNVEWYGDGFFYSRFPRTDRSLTTSSRTQTVWFHRIGTGQDGDVLVFANPDEPDPGYMAVVTPDEELLCLVEWVGTSRSNGLLYRPLADFDAPWARLRQPGVGIHLPLLHEDGALIVHTDVDAPNGRIARLDLADPDELTDVIAETDHPLAAAGAAAGSIFTVSLVDASHRVTLHAPDGTPRESLELPESGTVSAVNGRFSDPVMFLGFESFLRPPSALRWQDGQTTLFAGAPIPDVADTVEIRRIHATSTDGAQVGMFMLARRDVDLPAPVELYGYGGFAIDLTPMFDPARLAFVEAGGVSVTANLRGGTEGGEEWHQQGMLGRKQQVFDDFIACAEDLVARGIGTPSSIAIRGRSNGGLLTAAVMLQRPDLFGAVVTQVPVADMLRYQLFTAGRYWTVEYGDATEDPEAFAWLIRYSPYHRASEIDPRELPPLLITTAETDDRVVPMHSLKLAAALQHAAGGASDDPILVRIETRAGHGLGKPTSKLIAESADVFGFVLHHTTRRQTTDDRQQT